MGKVFPSLFSAMRVMLMLLAVIAQPALAAEPDLPLAAASPLSGVGFDDKPLFLPVQKNFQMAMLTAGSELGRSCGKMEAYGWRLASTEQARVDTIFNTTVDRFRGMGYDVEMQSPNSVSRDITMFTADHASKHFLAMWSAGEIGLVMVLCETGAPHGVHASAQQALPAPSVQTFAAATPVPTSALGMPATNKDSYAKFNPMGSWVGSYICGQGYTGGTLTISQMRGDNFEGTFHFYPTVKNPSVPEGRYTVYGQYDRASQRILINPGKWLERPANFYNTIIVGSFDPITETLSAYFQGVNGCTSFEAKLTTKAKPEKTVLHHKHAKPKKVAKPKAVKTSAAKPEAASPLEPKFEPMIVDVPVGSVKPAPSISDPIPTPAPPKPAVKPAPKAEAPAPTPPPIAAVPAAVAAAIAAQPAAAPAPAAPAVPVSTDVPPLVVGAPTPGPSK